VKESLFKFACVILGMGAFILPCHADTHIYVGALGTNQNDKLQFNNGALFDATLSDYSFPQILRTNGLNAGYYRGDVLTFSALPATILNGGPIPGSAALGARLAVEVVSVAGPPEANFSFWEGDGESPLGSITFSVLVGTIDGTNRFRVSENSGEPNADPYGHIHGRVFAASRPGTYVVGFRAVDISTNGTDGSPIHSPSDILQVRFQAGLKIENLEILTNRVRVSFRSPPGISNLLEATDSIMPANWQPAAAPLRGNNNLQSFAASNAPAATRIFRIRQLNNLP
jgi:hypothetical protein